jgi:hypothetical protein
MTTTVGKIEQLTQLGECVRMLKFAQKELDLLYHFAISNGICEAGIPPHETIKEFLNKNKLT